MEILPMDAANGLDLVCLRRGCTFSAWLSRILVRCGLSLSSKLGEPVRFLFGYLELEGLNSLHDQTAKKIGRG